MRKFKYYSPLRIARHVSAFFKGDFEIEGCDGMFRFDRGRVVVEAGQDARLRKIGNEINRVIAGFSHNYSQA